MGVVVSPGEKDCTTDNQVTLPYLATCAGGSGIDVVR